LVDLVEQTDNADATLTPTARDKLDLQGAKVAWR
jgi:hypothetical protein